MRRGLNLYMSKIELIWDWIQLGDKYVIYEENFQVQLKDWLFQRLHVESDCPLLSLICVRFRERIIN